MSFGARVAAPGRTYDELAGPAEYGVGGAWPFPAEAATPLGWEGATGVDAAPSRVAGFEGLGTLERREGDRPVDVRSGPAQRLALRYRRWWRDNALPVFDLVVGWMAGQTGGAHDVKVDSPGLARGAFMEMPRAGTTGWTANVAQMPPHVDPSQVPWFDRHFFLGGANYRVFQRRVQAPYWPVERVQLDLVQQRYENLPQMLMAYFPRLTVAQTAPRSFGSSTTVLGPTEA